MTTPGIEYVIRVMDLETGVRSVLSSVYDDVGGARKLAQLLSKSSNAKRTYTVLGAHQWVGMFDKE